MTRPSQSDPGVPLDRGISKRRNGCRRMLACCLLLALAGCSLAPTYQRPTMTVPGTYKETSSLWTQAAPADMQARGNWWTLFGDAALDGL